MSEHLGVTLAALVDGQLNHDDRDRAFAHLARCPACQADVAAQRALKARLSALAAPAMPGSLAQRLAAMTVPVATPAPPQGRAGAAVGQQLEQQKLERRKLEQREQERQKLERRKLEQREQERQKLERPPAGQRPRHVVGGAAGSGSIRPPAPSPQRGPGPSRRRFGRRPERVRQPTQLGQPRRHRMRTLVGASAVMLVAVAGSVTLADSRNPAGPAQPVTAPTARNVVPPTTLSPLQRFTSVSLLPISYVQIP